MYSRGKKIVAKKVRVRNGKFSARFRMKNAARLAVRVVHQASPELKRVAAGPLRFDVLPQKVEAGQTGTAVKILQRHLARKGYVVGKFGSMDGRTQRAIIAFRKVAAMARTASANRDMLAPPGQGRRDVPAEVPEGEGPPRRGRHLAPGPRPGQRGQGRADLPHEHRARPATPTVRGSFEFYMAQPGYNSKEMYWSKYFIRGYAIHGYKSVPVFNASHGCLRVPLDDAVSIYNWIQIGDRIDVYD